MMSSVGRCDMVQEKPRYAWIDVLKFLGIWMVYIQHTKCSGHLMGVIPAVLPLFFFASGFFIEHKMDKPFLSFAWEKFRQLMFPYYFFLLLFFVPMWLVPGYHPDLEKCVLQGLLGMRDRVFVAALWFLPCLLLMLLLYYVLRRSTRNLSRRNGRLVMLLAGFLLWGVSLVLIPRLPCSLPFSAEWALRYFLFFVLGAILFPFLKDFKYQTASRPVRLTVLVTGIAAVFLLVCGVANQKYFWRLYPPAGATRLLIDCVAFGRDFLLFYAFLIVSRLLENLRMPAEVGRWTLLLCGTEQLSSLLLRSFAEMLGLHVRLTTPMDAVLWGTVCLLFSAYVLIPGLVNAFPFLNGGKRMIRAVPPSA